MAIFGIALTLFLAETIPLDRQFKVRELIDALPISRAMYLGGKVLGVWAGLALIVLVGGAVNLITARLMIGLYDVRVVALLWLGMALPCSGRWARSVCWRRHFSSSRRVAVMFGIAAAATDPAARL